METKQIFSVSKMGGKNLMRSSFTLKKQIRLIFKNAKDKNARVIFVVSAFEKVTRLLDDIFISMVQKNGKDVTVLFELLKEIHYRRIRDWDLVNENTKSKIEKYFSEIELFIKKDFISENRTVDQAHLLKYGELLSSIIFVDFLSKIVNGPKLVDARGLLKSSPYGSSYIDSVVDVKESVQNILLKIIKKKENVFVTQGYISQDIDSRNDSVLGYDSSDITAAIIIFALITYGKYVVSKYWKDVKGVLPDLRYQNDIYPVLTFSKYLELSTTDSVPVHPKAIKLLLRIESKILKKYLIELSVGSFMDLESIGTILKP